MLFIDKNLHVSVTEICILGVGVVNWWEINGFLHNFMLAKYNFTYKLLEKECLVYQQNTRVKNRFIKVLWRKQIQFSVFSK